MSGFFISDEKVKRLEQKYTLADEPISTEIYLDGQLLIYDKSQDTFYYSLVQGAGSAYNPTVRVDDCKVYFSGEKLSKETIKQAKTISIITYDADKLHISKLAATTLPVMNLSLKGATTAPADFVFDEDVKVDFYLFDNSEEFSDYVVDSSKSDGRNSGRGIHANARIHTRGQTSRAWDTVGYRLETNKKLNLFDIREDDDWILTSAYLDYEKVRNTFASNLWTKSFSKDNEWAVKNGVTYKFFELFIDGHYRGLYAICDRFDEKQVDLKVKSGEAMYKKKDWSMSEYNEVLDVNEATGEKYLGGYSLMAGDADYEELLSLYHNFEANPDLYSIRATQDIDNAIDLWLFFKMTQASDNVYGKNIKNIIVTTKNSDSGVDGKKLLIAPWDLDYTFNYWEESDEDLPYYVTPVLYLMFRNDPTICDEIRTKYHALRKQQWSDEQIDEMLFEYESQIFDSGAFVRTREAFPDGNYQDEDIRFEKFSKRVHDRLEYMDEFIETLDNSYAKQ